MPGSTYVHPAGTTAAIQYAIAGTNVLTVSSANTGFEGAQDDGFFLFKYVPGDFQASVHVTLNGGVLPPPGFENPGILARAYGYDTNGNIGAPFTGTENWVSFTRFDQFGIGCYPRLNLRNGVTQSGQGSVGDGFYYLLMVRRGGANFYFFQRTNTADAWVPTGTVTGGPAVTYNVPAFVGQPMQVGLLSCGFNSQNTVVDQFDNFLLDVGSPELQITRSGGNVILSWPSAANATLLSSPSLSSPNWQPVPGTPVLINGQDTMTIPATGKVFYRVVH